MKNRTILIIVSILIAILVAINIKPGSKKENVMEKQHSSSVSVDFVATVSEDSTNDNDLDSPSDNDISISANDTIPSISENTPDDVPNEESIALPYSSYCQNNRLSLRLASTVTSKGLIYYPQNPSSYNMAVDCEISFGNIESTINGNLKITTIPVTITVPGMYTLDDIDYKSAVTPFIELADDYSGYIIPMRSTKGNDTYAYGVSLKSGGTEYSINYTVSVSYNYGNYTSIGGGNYVRPIIFNATYTVESPSYYDGLILKITPNTSLSGLNAVSIDSTLHKIDENMTQDILLLKIQ